MFFTVIGYLYVLKPCKEHYEICLKTESSKYVI